MIVIEITPQRFVASGGKLDSDKGYVQRADDGRFRWPGLTTETMYMVNGQLYFRNRNLHGGATGWKDSGEARIDV